MERIRARLERYNNNVNNNQYEQLDNESTVHDTSTSTTIPEQVSFSWLNYGIFVCLGTSMLWAYNMFLAAGPYLIQRFNSSEWIVNKFQAIELCVSTIGTLGIMLFLIFFFTDDNHSFKWSYPKRISTALVINSLVFTLLAVSTQMSLSSSAVAYFVFVMFMVFLTSLAMGIFQNALFAFVAGFGQVAYTQGIMVGQAIAGVLPCIAQIGLVVLLSPPSTSSSSKRSVRDDDVEPSVPPRAAMGYFLTAIGLSLVTSFLFSILLRRRQSHSITTTSFSSSPLPSSISTSNKSFFHLLRQTNYYSAALIYTFTITMLYPVYTQRIIPFFPSSSNLSSKDDGKSGNSIDSRAIFIPLAFASWNLGDLLGRLSLSIPFRPFTVLPSHRKSLLLLALLRTVWIPLYAHCDGGIKGGKWWDTEAFYFIVVQLGFGFGNGLLGSACIVGATVNCTLDTAGEEDDGEERGGLIISDRDGVKDEKREKEREVVGSFMALCLVFGLALGSFMSFVVVT